MGYRLVLLGIFSSLWLMPALGAEPASGSQIFVHNGPESPGDTRYNYHWRVLKAALEATKAKHGPYTLRQGEDMIESRQLFEMQQPNGRINTMVIDATVKIEEALHPVKIPIDKGLMGYRVLLIRAEDQPKFDQVMSLDDMRKFSIGQGADWSDVEILQKAGFTVVGGTEYEALFRMLMARRFDVFSRAVTEIRGEFKERGPKFPGMAIEKRLMLYYPLPSYFWFPRTPEGLQRARRVEEGMRQLIANGTLDKLFQQEFGDVVSALNLRSRRLFRFDNPTLPPDQPFADRKLWFDPGLVKK